MLTIAITDPVAISRWRRHELDLVLRLARRARLLGRLAAKLSDAGVLSEMPAIAVDQLRAALAGAQSRERLVQWEMNRVAEALRSSATAPLILLKGSAYLLLNLPNTAGRSLVDVDFLTAERELPAVEERLRRCGWRSHMLTPYDDRYYRRWTHEIPPLIHREREVEVDLHHNILPRVARLKPSASDLIASSRSVDGAAFRVLSPEDMTLHAMVHLAVDSDFSDKLRDLVDIDELLRYFAAADRDFWERLIERSTLHGLGRPLYYCLRYCRLLLDSRIPDIAWRSASRWAPPGIVKSLMDVLVPAALFPAHPDAPTRSNAWLRRLLFVRSHWLRMPPWLLAYHAAHKVVATRFQGEARDHAA